MAFEGMATPLGMNPGHGQRGVPPSWRMGLLVLFVLCIGILLVISLQRRGDKPGVPGVISVIERVESSRSTAVDRAPEPVPEGRGGVPAGGRSAVAEIEAGSGVNVIRQNGGSAPAGVVIKVPESPERANVAYDPRVSERSQHGLLPRIGDNGLVPRILYAHPFAPTTKPRIGIVMTGVGIGARGTADAITKLPGAVTLAFAPYGRDLENQVLRARRDGHEVLLQIPMEPQDYPESDPGPHTLKASASPHENIERLHWLMSRFTGYVGLTNFMGGKLMTQAGPYGALLEEINRRGLLFLDDGTTARSRTLEIGNKINLPVQIADRILDTGGTKPLEALLQEVEDLAVRNGAAILSVPALPANIDKISNWARELSARGLVLAPVSAIIKPSAR